VKYIIFVGIYKNTKKFGPVRQNPATSLKSDFKAHVESAHTHQGRGDSRVERYVRCGSGGGGGAKRGGAAVLELLIGREFLTSSSDWTSASFPFYSSSMSAAAQLFLSGTKACTRGGAQQIVRKGGRAGV